jgi:radical SAM superfamily enzyme YgiQ (UPF0313 family)
LNIALIYPPFLEERVHKEEVGAVPMGLFFLAARLKADGHAVDVFNWHDLEPNPETIRRYLTALAPDLVGFSILQANRWGGLDIAGIAKALNPEIHTVFGGVGATFLWAHLLEHFPQVDTVVVGEGERSFPGLVRALAAGGPMAAIPGIAYRKAGRPVFTGPAEPVRDLDSLPNPAEYFAYAHLSLTRGCPADCRFCGSPRFWGRRVRSHSADYFVAQMVRLCERGVRFFFVSDDTFTLKRDRVIEVCKKIIGQNLDITWSAISRVDAVDEAMLVWMRRAGCIQISFGVESGDAGIRRQLGKKLTDAQIQRAFDLTAKVGILPRAYFIYGCPGESRATIDATLSLIEKIKPLAAIFYILDIFPGTALYDDYLARTGATDDIWLERMEDILYFETDPALSKGDVLAFGKTLRDGFHNRLSRFALDLELVDDPDLYALHADFLSRLALTFDQGDYSRIEAIPDREKTAEMLYRRALSWAPDARAFLGLGAMHQRNRALLESIEILSRGLKSFPNSEELHICLAVSLMNTGEFTRALEHLVPYEDNPQAIQIIIACHRALGDKAVARRFEKRIGDLHS